MSGARSSFHFRVFVDEIFQIGRDGDVITPDEAEARGSAEIKKMVTQDTRMSVTTVRRGSAHYADSTLVRKR